MQTLHPIAIVTGGSRGLGKSTALHLARSGHDVILTYQSAGDAAAAVVAAIVAQGRKADVRPCTGCITCENRMVEYEGLACQVNAAIGRGCESEFKPAATPKKVAVVGGGPAGMEAARVAAERGHDVTLFEKKDQIGGQITIAAKAPQRDQIAGITRWYQLELARLKVDLRLGTAADVATR